MQLTCVFNSKLDIQLVDDEEQYDKLIASGNWFESQIKAKESLIKNERKSNEKQRLHDEKGKGISDSKSKTSNGPSST